MHAPRAERYRRRSRSPTDHSPRVEERRRMGIGSEDTRNEEEEEKKKEQPNFELSGMLAAETNTFQGVVVKYNEPVERSRPAVRWRIYVFKDQEQIGIFIKLIAEILHVHRQSAYLMGRDRRICDIPMDHPSISLQHAALQYRIGQNKQVKPFLVDLDSTNGTILSNEKLEGRRYYEVKSGDVVKFGLSTREYVFLREDAAAFSGREEESK